MDSPDSKTVEINPFVVMTILGSSLLLMIVIGVAIVLQHPKLKVSMSCWKTRLEVREGPPRMFDPAITSQDEPANIATVSAEPSEVRLADERIPRTFEVTTTAA